MKNEKDIVHYYHHSNRPVAVRKDLKGKHREYCLCWSCERFTPEARAVNCSLASLLFSINQIFDLVTPVWECPLYREKKQ